MGFYPWTTVISLELISSHLLPLTILRFVSPFPVLVQRNAFEEYPGGIATPNPLGFCSRYDTSTFASNHLPQEVLNDLNVYLADVADWVSPEYMIDQRTNPAQDTANAKKSLVGIAGTYGRKGPWSECLISVSRSARVGEKFDCDC